MQFIYIWPHCYHLLLPEYCIKQFIISSEIKLFGYNFVDMQHNYEFSWFLLSQGHGAPRGMVPLRNLKIVCSGARERNTKVILT